MNTDHMYDWLGSVEIRVDPQLVFGSACGPVIVPVFKTGGRQVSLSPMGSTPIRFRHLEKKISTDPKC
jgi:hypothetical protein